MQEQTSQWISLLAGIAGWFGGGLLLHFAGEALKPWVWERGRKLKEFAAKFSRDRRRNIRIARLFETVERTAHLKKLRKDAGYLQRHTTRTILYAILGATAMLIYWLSGDFAKQVVGLLAFGYLAGDIVRHVRDLHRTDDAHWEATNAAQLAKIIQLSDELGIDRAKMRTELKALLTGRTEADAEADSGTKGDAGEPSKEPAKQ